MDSPYVPAGPSVAPTLQTSHPVVSPTSTPQLNSSSTGISTASTLSIAFFLSLFTLAALQAIICWIRRRRTASKASDGDRPLEKEAVHDVEALAATCSIAPVIPLPDVRWAPQIRSISGPTPDEDTDRKSAALFPKRARSPPPSNSRKPRNLFPDPYPKSAPAHALSFSHHETPHLAKSPRGELSPPVTPLALAVSGMETRFLGRPGLGSKN